MSSALFSQSWYLVADLRVRLRHHVKVHRHVYREQVWFLLEDKATGQFHRFTPEAWQVIGLIDDQRTLQEIWEQACQSLGDEMPSQDEVVAIISRLFQANVLQSDAMPDIDKLYDRRRTQARNKFLQQLKSPLGVRLPLWDPEKFLNLTMPLIRPLFSIWGALLWLLGVTYSLSLAVIHWQPLTENMADRVLAAESLVLMALIYPLVKGIHELGHAYTVKRWGGEVHEIGIMFLVFFPVPYVDASAALAFRSKWSRMLVGAAGIITEVFIAALAMILWVNAEPGVVRAMAFNTMIIAGVSTLLFNGNPLLKFDAYYVLSDFLEIPNFGQKANKYFAYLVKKYLVGVKGLRSSARDRAEKSWLAGYAVAAYIYRLLVMASIALFIAYEYFFIGIVLALWLLYMSIVSPLLKVLVMTGKDPRLRDKKRTIISLGATVVCGLAAFLFLIPLPYATNVEGVVVPGDESIVRAEVGGFVTRVVAGNGATVAAGDLLIEMSDPQLVASSQTLKARVSEARAALQASLQDRVQSGLNREVLQYTTEEYEETLAQQQALNVVSREAGELILPDFSTLHGQFFERGDKLGFIIDYNALPIITMIHEDNIEKVRTDVISVNIRKVSDIGQSYKAEITRIVPASTSDLPSEVLSTKGGGEIALAADGGRELKSFEQYFILELKAEALPKTLLEERVYVRFEHKPEPLAQRIYRSVRRLFLRRFDV